ncbi:YciI family protein [Aeromicrobium sp. NPDC092404]|uniref:YciI family protein n=1 Tax=Aeromicrobium sp. NPDC092404 TaxID=3154976 RepID=UPI003417B835
MTKYLITFTEGAMVPLSHPDLPAIAKAAEDASQEAMDAGVWVFGGGLMPQVASTVSPQGLVTDGPFPETKEFIGGFVVVEVDTRDEAHQWAARFAEACRCDQEVRVIDEPPEESYATSHGA